MRALPSAAHHVVTIARGSEAVAIEMAPVPIGYGTMLDAVYPAPVIYINGKETPDAARTPEWQELKGLVLIAKSIVGDAALTTGAPPPSANREAWHAYALAVREEFNAAGFVTGDIVALMVGFRVVNEGGGLGKAGSPGKTAE